MYLKNVALNGKPVKRNKSMDNLMAYALSNKRFDVMVSDKSKKKDVKDTRK